MVYNWEKTGYLYENYDAETGIGQRGYPFNGWTSLVILIINEKYDWEIYLFLLKNNLIFFQN